MTKRICSVVLALVMVLALVPPARAAEIVDSGTCGENLTWELDDKGTLTIKGTGEMTDYQYSSKAPWYQRRNDIMAVEIENGVTSIGQNAFAYCSNIGSITIPSSVEQIGERFIYSCRYLPSISVDPNNANYCAVDGVLFNKSMTELIKWPAGKSANSYTIPDSVTSVGYEAFAFSRLQSVTISDSVTTLGDSAFWNNNHLRSVTIPVGVSSIGSQAFGLCYGLEAITVASDNASYSDINGVLFNKNKTELVQYPIGLENTAYEIPSGVTTVGVEAFRGAENLSNVTIPSSVRTISRGAFIGTGLKNLMLPNGVETIDYSAFSSCWKLTNVILPGSLTTLAIGAFSDCTSLTSIKVDPDNEKLCDIDGVLYTKQNALYQYPIGRTDESYVVPSGTTFIWYEAFAWCANLKSVTLQNGVVGIMSGAFEYCENLASVTIPSSVTGIEWGAFEGCDALTDVYYGGTEAQWKEIEIDELNEPLLNANIHYTAAPVKPSAPATVKATAKDGNITVTWSKVDGATRYAVYRRTYDAATGKWVWDNNKKPIAKVKNASYTDKNAGAGYYAYYVRAYKDAWSGYSKNAKAYIKPDAPANLKATAVKGSVKITWDASASAGKYAIYRNVYDASAKKWTGWQLLDKTLTDTSYTDSSVTKGVKYAYIVRAYNGVWSANSKNVKAIAR